MQDSGTEFTEVYGIHSLVPQRSQRNERMNAVYLGDLCTTILHLFCFSASISRCPLCNLLKRQGLVLKDRRENLAALGGDVVAVRAGDFADQSMGAQEANLARDLATGASAFLRVGEALAIQPLEQVLVTKAVQAEVPVVDRLQQAPVRFGP